MTEINNLLITKRLSAAQAARLLGVHRSTVGRWLKGETPCPQWALELIEFKANKKIED